MGPGPLDRMKYVMEWEQSNLDLVRTDLVAVMAVGVVCSYAQGGIYGGVECQRGNSCFR